MNTETSAVVQSVVLRAIDGYFYKIKIGIKIVLTRIIVKPATETNAIVLAAGFFQRIINLADLCA